MAQKNADKPQRPTNASGVVAAPATPGAATAFDLWCAAHLSGGSSLRRQQRSVTGAPAGLTAAQIAQPGAVLEVHFADGSVFFTDPLEFAARHGRAASSRAPGAEPRIELPFDLASQRGPRRRGESAAPVERYTLSELTEPSTLDRLYDFGAILGHTVRRWFGASEQPAEFPLATKLCAAFENASLHAAVGASGGALLRWSDDGWSAVPPKSAVATAGKPVLLFLHGTASSTEGSFGKLWTRADGAPAPIDWQALAERATLLAWDHRSLTRSPIDNLIELIAALDDALADGTRVDVVSHSRGGLVGELFALRSAGGRDAVQAVFADCHAAVDGRAAHPDAQRLGTLFGALARAERLPSGSFVRVACPARGTLLADGRTDLFLSLTLRALQLATGGVATLVFERFAGLVRALVAARADARSVPGLEAMIPGSPLTLALARCGAEPTDRLRVIAGDSQGKGWGGILTLMGDVFYGAHDHDFVVHTRSMFGGLKRRAQPPLSLRLEGESVTHFTYFAIGSASRSALFATLDARDDAFAPLAEDEARTRGMLQALKRDPLSRRDFAAWQADWRAPERASRPVLVVLAGIMGSELKRPDAAPDEPMWLSLGALLGGDLEDLQFGRAELVASGLLAASYERLLEAARAQFRVLGFPFDWRQPIPASGALLVEQLRRVIDAVGDRHLPIHLLVHSMGGLVARDALFVNEQGRALWAEALRPRGSRLLMLGTPNKGSYAPAQLLLGENALARVLAVLARKVSSRDLSRFGAGFPGLLQMLPQAGDPEFGDLFEMANWRRVAEADAGTHLPDEASLAQARDYVRSAAFQASYDALCADEQVLYVAGSGETPLRMGKPAAPWQNLYGEGGTVLTRGVEFLAGPDGDGTVPWSSTLAPARTWYAPCEHGTLPDHTEAFGAYFDLLNAGSTSALPQQPPRRRSAAGEPLALRALPPVAQPPQLPESDEELAAYLLERGGTSAPPQPQPEPIEVHVIHGGLDYARYPLMVGHYQNDSLSGAAARVDEKLGGQLQQALDLKLFVGAGRTGHYLRPNNHSAAPPAYPGALILGLGTVGELTPGSLAESVTRGVLRYAFEHVHRDPYSAPGERPVELRLSTVLIGTHVQAVTARDSLAGLLYGVWRAAQLLLQLRGLNRPVRILELEIIEIEEQVALDAAYELRRLLQRGEWAERLRWDHPVLESREGALRGYRPRSGSAVWQRLVVRQDALGGLNFALIGERARVESTQVYSDVASLRRFIDRVSDHQPAPGDRIASPTDPRFGGVLFQMLLPYELKERLANLDNTVLVLDDESARYPWELLSPPLASPADGETPRPFVVHAGLVRQRLTDDFRKLPQAITGLHALIVGAPSTANWRDARGDPLPFSELAGAEDEARAVNELLLKDERAWLPATLIGPAVSFEQVRIALLEQPYRLLHLCGHGVVDQWVRQVGSGPDARAIRKTGMVLSDQEVLGAADVEQMSPVPEFVFINCCYSGRDGEPAPGPHRHPVLAASLALQFIKMGARAVVAAGWQVDDDAALLFARALYGALLAGESFGEAVRGARSEVHREHGDRHNTWGAYQCYGDPQWRLQEPTVATSAPSGTSRLREAEQCMSLGELADRIAQVVEIAGDKAPAVVLGQLDKLVATLAKDRDRAAWLQRSRVRAALGEAYRELGDQRRAAEWFQLAARGAWSRVEIGQLELLVNSMARATDPDGPIGAERLLDLLDEVSGDERACWPLAAPQIRVTGARSERACQRGDLRLRAAARALAAGALGDARPELVAATRQFAQGFRDKQQLGDDPNRRAYALGNALLAATLAGLASEDVAVARAALGGIAHGAGASLGSWLAAGRALCDELDVRDHAASFWHHTNRLELQIAGITLAHLHAPSEPLDGLGAALDGLDAALVRWPSPTQLEGLRYRFELMRDLALALPGGFREDLRQALPVLAELALERLIVHGLRRR